MKPKNRKILDIKLVKFLAFFCFISFSITAVSWILAKMEGFKFLEVPYSNLLLGVFLLFVAEFIYILSAIFVSRLLILKGSLNQIGHLGLHILAGVGLNFYSAIVQILLYDSLYSYDESVTANNIYRAALEDADFTFFHYFSMVSIVYIYYFFKRQKDAQLKESTLKAQLLDAKVNSLQYQLQPHFLFNVLNDISALIDVSKEKSQNAIADLSEILRETLSLKDIKHIPLSQEVSILKKYLDIEKMRFNEKLNYTIQMDEEIKHLLVPPLIFQPIVENSIRHGFSYRCDYLEVVISLKNNDDTLECIILNNGEQLGENQIIRGTGIGNVISRLETLYDGSFDFEMDNLSNGNGVFTRIIIPRQEPDSKLLKTYF